MKKALLSLIFTLTFVVSAMACGYCWNNYSNCLSSASWKHTLGIYSDLEFIVANNNCMNTYISCCNPAPYGKN